MPTARRSLSALAAALMALALCNSPAQAHAKLLASDPAANAAVTAPKSIQLQFSEEIAKKLSSFTLTAAGGVMVKLMLMESKDPKTLNAMPIAALAAGLYTVSWTAVATDDAHKTSGQFSFTVR